jgi:hypothetical protein
MLAEYLEKYYHLILNKLLSIIEEQQYTLFINNQDHKNFLMNGDISSIINRLIVISKKDD